MASNAGSVGKKVYMPKGNYKNTKAPAELRKWDKQMFDKIIACHQRDFTIEETCHSCGIVVDTYYRWLNEVEGLSEEIKKARSFLFRTSKQNLAKAIEEGDVRASEWLLERRLRDQYSTRQQNEVKAVSDFSNLTDEQLQEIAYGEEPCKQLPQK